MLKRYAQCRTVTHPEQFSGTDISIENSVNAPFNSLSLTGAHVQDGVPSPDNPAPIVPANGKMYVGGRNLVDVEDFKATVVSGLIYHIFPQPALRLTPATWYQCSFDYVINSATNNVGFGVGYGDAYYKKDILHTVLYPTQTSGRLFCTFQTPEFFDVSAGIPYLQLRPARIGATGSFDVDISNLQVSIGSTEKPYRPYQPIQEITLPDLYGEGGVRDEWNALTGMGVRRWKTHVFDGTEPIALYSYPPLPELDGFRYNTGDIKQASRGDGSCNVLPTIKNDVPPGVWFSRNDSNVFFVGVRAIAGNSVEEIKAYLAAEYANGTPWVITYQLAESEAFSQGGQAVRTYYPETNIWTDAAVKPGISAAAKIIGSRQASGEGVVTLPGTMEPIELP